MKSQCLRVIQSIHYIKPSIHCRNCETKISTSPGGSSSLWVSTTFGTLKALSYSWEVLRHASGTSQENSHMYVYPHLRSMSSLVQIDKRKRIFQDANEKITLTGNHTKQSRATSAYIHNLQKSTLTRINSAFIGQLKSKRNSSVELGRAFKPNLSSPSCLSPLT